MNIIQLTPGAGDMYCGNCLRDNALATELYRQGHSVCMVPLYLPLTLDEEDQSANTPVFFGGINVYMQQKTSLWNFLPRPIRKLFDTKFVLRWIGEKAAKTNPSQLGDITISMLKGENGKQKSSLIELKNWLISEQKPDVLVFSNALLLGMHGMLKNELKAKTVCMLSGEDWFLDGLHEPYYTQAWEMVAQHARQVDLLIAPSRHYADYMAGRLNLPKERILVIPNGLNTAGYENQESGETESKKDLVLGYFARMSQAKGVDILVDAYIKIRERGHFPNLKLKIGGGVSGWNELLVFVLTKKLELGGYGEDVSFHPNVGRNEKIQMLKSLDLFCVPALDNESFGLYAIEALAAGVPVLLPNRAAFPEIVNTSGAGRLYEPDSDPKNLDSLVEAIENMLSDETARRQYRLSAKKSVAEHYLIETMAKRFCEMV